MLRFEKGDICVTIPPYRTIAVVITGIDPSRPKNAYSATNLVNGKSYRLNDDSIKKIGEVTEDYSKADDGKPSPIDENNLATGKMRAEREMLYANDDIARQRWGILAKATTGSPIKAIVRGRADILKFKHVVNRGYKYVFLAENSNGTIYRYPLSVISLKQEN